MARSARKIRPKNRSGQEHHDSRDEADDSREQPNYSDQDGVGVQGPGHLLERNQEVEDHCAADLHKHINLRRE